MDTLVLNFGHSFSEPGAESLWTVLGQCEVIDLQENFTSAESEEQRLIEALETPIKEALKKGQKIVMNAPGFAAQGQVVTAFLNGMVGYFVPVITMAKAEGTFVVKGLFDPQEIRDRSRNLR